MKHSILFLFLLAATSLTIKSQNAGVIDSSFGSNGFADSGQPVYISQFGSVLVQPDSNIVCIQRTGTVAVYDIALVRFLPNGNPDNSFGNNGVALTITTANETPTCAALQNDGKILVGSTATDTGQSFGTVMRYKTNGTPDSTFGVNGIYKSKFPAATADGIGAMVVLPNGEILAGGNTSTAAVHNSSIIKLQTNGTLDSTFGVNGRVKGNGVTLFSMAMQGDGKIVLGGRTLKKMAITRYKSNGVIDSAFGTNGLVETTRDTAFMSWAINLFVLPNGNIIGAGGLKTSNLLLIEFMAMQIDSNGIINSSYGANGAAVDSVPTAYIVIPSAATLQADNKLIIAGQIAPNDSTGYRFSMVRFNTNGTVDQSFGNNGLAIALQEARANCDAIAIQHDNKILLGGTRNFGSGTYTITVARFGAGTLVSDMEDVPVNGREITVYPNPSNGKFRLTVSVKSELEIYNVIGEKVYETTNIRPQTPNEIDLTALSKGFYFLKLFEGNEVYTKRIIIQ